jgi:uncharacterized repeat protein (TIGR03803 family)
MKNTKIILCISALASLSALSPVQAQSNNFHLVHSFAFDAIGRTNNGGGSPAATLLLSGNTLYGTAQYGGAGGNGTVFRVNTDGSSFTNLHSFAPSPGDDDLRGAPNSDGTNPSAGVVLSGNRLYGTTQYGGSNGAGTIFQVNTDGSGFTNLQFDVGVPNAGLWLSGNTLYGTTTVGRTNFGAGSVFAIDTDGLGFTNLHCFSEGTNGFDPMAGVIMSGGTLYGAVAFGGPGHSGTVFAVNTDGSGFTNLHSFTALSDSTNRDGAFPEGNLILSGDTLYGTTSFGGPGASGTVFRVNTDGSGFTNLYSFTGGSSGANPSAGVVLSGNTLYGTTYGSGSANGGTVFAVNTDGTGFTALHEFTGGKDDGYSAVAGLVLSGNTLYGATFFGGAGDSGTVFALTLPGPALGIAQASNQVVISWPASATNLVLQTTPDLSCGCWTNITNGIITVGTNYNFTTSAVSQNAFFRLQQQ